MLWNKFEERSLIYSLLARYVPIEGLLVPRGAFDFTHHTPLKR